LGTNPKKSKCLVFDKKQISTLLLQKLYINHTPISYEVNAVNLGITFNNTQSYSQSKRTYICSVEKTFILLIVLNWGS